LPHVQVNDIETTQIVAVVGSRKEDIADQFGWLFRDKTAKGRIGAEAVGEVLLRAEAVDS
jgi:hypothetical protein